MRKIRKQTLAEADLVGVWIYTHDRWGEVQAEQYFDELETAIAHLARNPELGRPCTHIRDGYRALRVKRHIVFYTFDASVVRIIRVLHDRMDPARRL